YRTYEFLITDNLVRGRKNVLALEVFAPTEKDLGINWVDWNPTPPDKDMGLWRGVWISQSGPLELRAPQIVTRVNNNEAQPSADGRASDRQSVRFGIRQVTSEFTPQGGRLFKVNGKPILIRGGGWSPDMLLREDPVRVEQHFRYVRDMGLNAIRLEGKMETQHFYDLADGYGILVMAGWCCCDIWEQWKDWPPENHKIAVESLKSQILNMRN